MSSMLFTSKVGWGSKSRVYTAIPETARSNELVRFDASNSQPAPMVLIQ